MNPDDFSDFIRSLNPYSTGRYSMRDYRIGIVETENGVLILILLEDTL